MAEVISEGLKNPVGPEIPALVERLRGKTKESDDDGSASSAGDALSLYAEDVSDGGDDASPDASEPGVAGPHQQGAEADRAATPERGLPLGSNSLSGAGNDVLRAEAGIMSAAVADSSVACATKKRNIANREDSAAQAAAGASVEAVSFSSLVTRKVWFSPSTSAARGGSAGASLVGSSAMAASTAGATTAQALDTSAAGPASGQAQATMSAMFAEPIKRRPITVRKSGAAVGSLGGMFARTSGAAVTVAPSQALGEGSAAGGLSAPRADAWDEGSRDKGAEVAAAAAALRAEAETSDVAAGPGQDAAAGQEADEEEPLSVRERYGRKRKAGGTLLGDVTAVPLSERRGKAMMLRLKNQSDKNVDTGSRRASAGDADAQMFDYEAILDGSDRLPSRQGRGRSGRGDRGRGRGGRDSGRHGQQGRRQLRGDEHKSSKRAGIFEGRKGGAWNPYAVEAAETIGKRSGGSAPKSANKSGNFRR